MDFKRTGEVTWELAPQGGMRVPGRVFASPSLFAKAEADRALQQVANVAHLPGIVEASFAMPDIHWGYGFPIGGVAATDVAAGGVVSPGGVGFDICCGVRLLASALTEEDFRRHQAEIMGELDARIPRGLGKGAVARQRLLDDVLEPGGGGGARRRLRGAADLERCEERGTSAGARPGGHLGAGPGAGRAASSARWEAGNHFLEIQVVDRVEDPEAAAAFGLAEGMVTVMIHCGSRGLGHQVCTDQLAEMGRAMSRHDITRPRPATGLRAGAIARRGRATWGRWPPPPTSPGPTATCSPTRRGRRSPRPWGRAWRRPGIDLVFDVAHNLAKVEEHRVGGHSRRLCVHRKGATRALRPGAPRAAGRPAGGRAAGAHPGEHGHRLVGAARSGGQPGLCHCRPRRRPVA